MSDAEQVVGDDAAAAPLDPAELEICQALVVLRDDATVPNVSIVTGLPIERVRAVTEVLSEQDRVSGHWTLHLTSTELAQDILQRTSDNELSRLHGRTARLLHDSGAPARVVAQHLLEAEPMQEEWVVTQLRDAAREHNEAGDQPARIAILRRLLAERLPSATNREILHELAVAESLVEPDIAAQHYRELIALTSDQSERARLRVHLARCLGTVRRIEDALEQLTSAADEATTAKDRMRAELLYIATARVSLDARPLARERVRKLAAEVESAPDGFDRDVFAELAYEECLAGAPKDGVVALVRRALGGSALDGVHDLEPATLHVATLSLVWCGELRDAERVARVTLARASRRGNQVLTGMANLWLMQVAWRRSRLDEMIDAASSALSASEPGFVGDFPAMTGFKALGLAMQGERDEAERLLILPGGEDKWSAYAHFHGYLHTAARVALLAGDHNRAYRLALRLGTLANSMGTFNPGVLPWRSIAAMAAAGLGDHAAGRALAEESVLLARQFGAPAPLAHALRAAAMNRSSPEEQLPLLEEALRFAEQAPERFERAQGLQELARALTALDRVDAAKSCLDLGRDLADQIGALPLLQAISADQDALEHRAVAAAAPYVRAAPRTSPTDDIRVLGQFAVLDADGRDVTPTGVPGRALRILVAAGGRLHLEQLGDRLWDEPIDAEQLRQRLRNVLGRTRASGGPLLVRRDEIVELRDGVTVDAVRFEEAARAALDDNGPDALESVLVAVSLYGGDLLPSDPFAEWAVLPRERLRRRFLSVVDVGARLATERGAVDVAIDLLESGMRHEPYDDDRYLRAAELHERAGRPAAARSLRRRASEIRVNLGIPEASTTD